MSKPLPNIFIKAFFLFDIQYIIHNKKENNCLKVLKQNTSKLLNQARQK